MRIRVLALLSLLLPPAALAGATDGPRAVVERVEGGATDVYWVEFAANEIATVSLAGDHDTNLDLVVYDETGHEIARDDGATDVAYLSWVPARTGRFLVKVHNLGATFNEYALTTN